MPFDLVEEHCGRRRGREESDGSKYSRATQDDLEFILSRMASKRVNKAFLRRIICPFFSDEGARTISRRIQPWLGLADLQRAVGKIRLILLVRQNGFCYFHFTVSLNIFLWEVF